MRDIGLLYIISKGKMPKCYFKIPNLFSLDTGMIDKCFKK